MPRKRRAVAGLTEDEFVAAVGDGLRNLHDLALLDLSPFADLEVVQGGAAGSKTLFAAGLVVQQGLKTALERVLTSLPANDSRSERLAATLNSYLASQSLASVARRFQRTRSYWSRTYGRQAVGLVAAEFMRELEALRLQQAEVGDAAKMPQVASNQR